MDFKSDISGVEILSGSEIPEVDLMPDLKEIALLISNTCEYFFKGNIKMDNAPFKGFILEGPPGTGKTEIIKQVANKLDRRLGRVFYGFVDGASIAAPKWGEAEKKLRSVFSAVNELKKTQSNPKIIILMDDIESLMISRGSELAKEWHYSINSILFHELDKLNPNNTIVCATTNRPDLVDEAIMTRLYRIKAPTIPIDQLNIIVEEILKKTSTKESDKEFIKKIIIQKLQELKNPTIRDARQITIVACIDKGVWSI